MASTHKKKHRASQKRLNKYVSPVVFGAIYFFDVGFAHGYSTLSALDKLRHKCGLRHAPQGEATYGSAAFMDQHMLANVSTPGTGSGNNGEQYNRLFTLERLLNSEGNFLHSWLTRQYSAMPGLDKDIEDAPAHSLALHGYLFG